MAIASNKIVSINRMDVDTPTFHWHDELELVLVTVGCIELKIGYEIRQLHSGDIMLINSDEIHSIRNLGGTASTINVYIDCNVCYDRFPNLYEIVAIWPYGDAFNQLNANSTIIIQNINEMANVLARTEDLDIITRHLDDLIKSIIYCYRIDLLAINEINSNIDDEKMDVIYRTIKYIYANFDHKVNLQEISEQEYMNLFHLSHSFKDITGYTFRDWLNFVRAEHAEKMLLQTALPLSEIAAKCGFSDVRYLNKHFLKWYNLSPNKYRDLFKSSYEMVDQLKDSQTPISMDKAIRDLSSLAVPVNATDTAMENVQIDLSSFDPIGKLDKNWQDKLICSISWFLDKRNLRRIVQVRDEMGFNSVTIDDMFTVGMSYISTSKSGEIYDILDFLVEKFSMVNIILNYSENYIYEIEAATDFLNEYHALQSSRKTLNLKFLILSSDPEYAGRSAFAKKLTDKLELYNLEYSFEQDRELSISLRSNNYIDKMIADELRVEWFFTRSGFKNNVYYFQAFLASLYDDIIDKTDTYILTGNGSSFKMLIFSDETSSNTSAKANYTIMLKNMNGIYKFIHHTWNFAADDSSALILNPKVIQHLSISELDKLDSLSTPSATFDIVEPDETTRSYTTSIDVSSTNLHLLEFIAI